MEIELLSKQEIECFYLEDEKPKHDEGVFIILEKGVDSGNYRPWTYRAPRNPIILTDKETLDFATFRTFKTKAPVFKCRTACRARTFTESEVICWGRLK